LIPTGDLKGTILIAAQDLFFAPKEPADTAQSAHEFATSIAQVAGMTIDRQPSEVSIAGRRFSRVDFSGVGLFRSTFFTRSRCHLVSFNLTTNDRALLETLAGSLDRIGPARNADSASADPMCVKDYARSNNLVAKVDPAPADPRFASIPVRMVIAADGSVKNVHVIRATAKQRDNIENALGHWKFRPGEADGRGAEIETGLLIEFNAGGTVTYSDDERQASNQRGAGKM
jgi:hypothetical protein